jgi:hypothetical protein
LEYIGYIYKITNRINGKSYVGQTIHALYKRLNTHFSKYSRCARLKSAITKYGRKNFEISILSTVHSNSQDDFFMRLNSGEKYWISCLETLHPNGYNLTDGGDRASMCEESRRNSIEHHKRPVLCIETGQSWPSVFDCANHFDVKPKQISRVLKGQRKRLKWAFTLVYLPKQS